MTSCLGAGVTATWQALQSQQGGLTPCAFERVDLQTYIGLVPALDDFVVGEHDAALVSFDCRNNRLAQLAWQQDGFAEAVREAIGRYGAERIGIFLGTSTSGILQTELAYRRRDAQGALPADFDYAHTHNTFSLADFARHYFQLKGPAVAVSSACSSSAKVFASAQRMMAAGLIDAALVGGVDTLCLTTLYGFNSLGLISTQPCRPYDAARDGLSIGEGGAFVLLERMPHNLPTDAVLLYGVGESSDAHHMSSPHPEGLGARMAMQAALDKAGLQTDEIDYINLHGTATLSNDAAEGKAVATLFGAQMPCSSTKGATGHTLGAAGGIEAVISALALQQGLMPAGINTQAIDNSIPIDYLMKNRTQKMRYVLSNSFGFGGTNCSLVLGRAV